MQTKSSQIKSKKEKLVNKYEQKTKNKDSSLKQPIQQIIIPNDSQSNHSSSVQILKQAPQLTKKIIREKPQFQPPDPTQSQKFNQFNIQKLKKIAPSIKLPSTSNLLAVQICPNITTNYGNDTRPINYKKAGSNISHKSCQNFLRARLQKMEDSSPKNQKQQLQNTGTAPIIVNQNGHSTNEFAYKIKKISRYFDDEMENSQQSNGWDDFEEDKQKSKKCYRCGEKGHIARLCEKEQIVRCIYCLGPHLNNVCPDKICRNCGQKGHMKLDCHNKISKIKCLKCGRNGHQTKNCGRVIMMNFVNSRQKQIRQKYNKQDLEKLKCFKCNGIKDSKGHFNCHQYYKKIPKIYQENHFKISN